LATMFVVEFPRGSELHPVGFRFAHPDRIRILKLSCLAHLKFAQRVLLTCRGLLLVFACYSP